MLFVDGAVVVALVDVFAVIVEVVMAEVAARR